MLSPYQIAEAIEAEVERMQTLVEEMRQAAVDTARAEADFKVRYAQQRLQARTSEQRLNIDTVDDLATVATENERYAHLIAANNLSTLREAIRASQAHIDALRTLAASHRAVAP